MVICCISHASFATAAACRRAWAVNSSSSARRNSALERQLERHDLRLRGLDPEGPLERGYAYAFTADGHFVRSIRDVQPGASLTVKIRDGEADTRVTAVRATGESHDIP